MKCLRCGAEEPRRTRDQVHCVRCSVEVANIIEADAKRRIPRFPAKDWTRATSW
jgi:hypothetical protein